MIAIDHLGNKYDSVSDMCRHWGISRGYYEYGKRKKVDLSLILTKQIERKRTGCYDHLGNKFDSVTDMCNHWGVNRSNYERWVRAGRDLESILASK